MNWMNSNKYYSINNMELISELIKKGIEIEEAIEC